MASHLDAEDIAYWYLRLNGFLLWANRTFVVFCDAEKGPYDFNDTWTNRDKRIMESFLALVGVIPRSEWSRVANELYETGRSELKHNILITALLIHHDPEHRVSMRLKSAQQIQIEHALQFIHRRFNAYHSVKTPHGSGGHPVTKFGTFTTALDARKINLLSLSCSK